MSGSIVDASIAIVVLVVVLLFLRQRLVSDIATFIALLGALFLAGRTYVLVSGVIGYFFLGSKTLVEVASYFIVLFISFEVLGRTTSLFLFSSPAHHPLSLHLKNLHRVKDYRALAEHLILRARQTQVPGGEKAVHSSFKQVSIKFLLGASVAGIIAGAISFGSSYLFKDTPAEQAFADSVIVNTYLGYGLIDKDTNGVIQKVTALLRNALGESEMIKDRRFRASGAKVEVSQRDAQHLFDLINDDRIKAGKSLLRSSEELDQAAYEHAEDMALNGFVGHVSPTRGDLAARLGSSEIEYSFAAENIAVAGTITEVEKGFMRSPAHRGNILSERAQRVGVAVLMIDADLLVVEVFADVVEGEER